MLRWHCKQGLKFTSLPVTTCRLRPLKVYCLFHRTVKNRIVKYYLPKQSRQCPEASCSLAAFCISHFRSDAEHRFPQRALILHYTTAFRLAARQIRQMQHTIRSTSNTAPFCGHLMMIDTPLEHSGVQAWCCADCAADGRLGSSHKRQGACQRPRPKRVPSNFIGGYSLLGHCLHGALRWS